MNQLIEGRKQMAKMMKAMGSGKMPALPGASGTMPAAAEREAPPERDAQVRKQAKKESEEVIEWQ